jgi:glycine cleavage system aminomethyltransferase T
VIEEVRATREDVSVFDISSFAKIEINGKDVTQFMNERWTLQMVKLCTHPCSTRGVGMRLT